MHTSPFDGVELLVQQHASGAHALVNAAGAATPGTITPFPGGVVRSGSKVGSRYEALRASTNEAFCPSLVGRVETCLVDGATCGLEIVIDGVDESAVAGAMVAGIRAAIGPDLVAISACNYGGKLGKFHFHLHQLLLTA
jgi:formylmethanofuran--tetrahydromethanopterin N-formyltransferase